MIGRDSKTRARLETRRYALHLSDSPTAPALRLGERVRAARPLRNDGTYPHREVGEILVRAGESGVVVEIARFRGETYYTIEFVERAFVLATRGRDLVRDASTSPL